MSWSIELTKNHTDHNRSEVDWSKSCFYKFGILVIDFSSENRDITSLCEEEEKNESEYMQDEPGIIIFFKKTYTVWLSCHVECSSFEFTKVLKEYRDESCYIFGCFFRGTLIIKTRDTVIIQLKIIMNTRTTDSPCSA